MEEKLTIKFLLGIAFFIYTYFFLSTQSTANCYLFWHEETEAQEFSQLRVELLGSKYPVLLSRLYTVWGPVLWLWAFWLNGVEEGPRSLYSVSFPGDSSNQLILSIIETRHAASQIANFSVYWEKSCKDNTSRTLLNK